MCRTDFIFEPFDSGEILIIRVFLNTRLHKAIQISKRCTCSANFADLARNKITCQIRKEKMVGMFYSMNLWSIPCSNSPKVMKQSNILC